ncbi:hypothetical protein EON64_06675, partial [archaeon]
MLGLVYLCVYISLSNPTGSRQGRRLASSSGFSAARPSTRRRVRATAGSTEDIAEHLIAAVSGGSGAHSQVLRATFRRAVELQYVASQAVARLGAVQANQFHLVVQPNVLPTDSSTVMPSLSSSSSSMQQGRGIKERNGAAGEGRLVHKLTASYRAGMVTRGGRYEETVDLLSRDLLHALICLPLLSTSTSTSTAEDLEVLRPVNLAKASPRIFWSLVHHHGPDLVQSILRITGQVAAERGVDMGWLTERKRALSEKAQQNKVAAQEQERDRARRKAITKKRKIG